MEICGRRISPCTDKRFHRAQNPKEKNHSQSDLEGAIRLRLHSPDESQSLYINNRGQIGSG